MSVRRRHCYDLAGPGRLGRLFETLGQGADMRIAIFGTGGAGGYFGAQLALVGEEVIFIARGDHLRAMKAVGLRFETPSSETIIRTQATDNPLEVGKVDVVLVGVKAWQVSDAAKAMQPLVGPDTVVVPLQNGVEAATNSPPCSGPARWAACVVH